MSTVGETVDQLRDIAKIGAIFFMKVGERFFLWQKIINSKLIDGPQAADCDDERW